MKKPYEQKLEFGEEFYRQRPAWLKNLRNTGPTFIDLFAGCGGMSLGMINAGLKCIWAIELSEGAYETYRWNLGHHIVRADIRKIPSSQIPDCDIVVGGPPCQGVSKCNMLRSIDDIRNTLMFEFIRVVRDKLPRMFLFENVPGLCSIGGYETKEDKKKKEGRFFKRVLDAMRDAGYDVAWQILDAADFGVPQHRRRILCFGQRRPIWSRDGKIWIENANTRKIAVLSEDKFKVFAKKELPEQINILTKIAESIGGKE